LEGPDISFLADTLADEDDDIAEEVAPTSSPEAPATTTPRPTTRRPKLILDSGLWVLLWVIGAIVLVTLIIVAVSQVPSNPKKPAGDGPPAAGMGNTSPWTDVEGVLRV
jgi:hypothetical protein